MPFHRLRTKRLLLVAASTEMLLGLCAYAYPQAFAAAGYAVLAPVLPLAAAALVGGGVLLLMLEEPWLPPWLRWILSLLPGVPIACFAFIAARNMAWTAVIGYGAMALALWLAPWIGESRTREPGPDLWYITFGLIQALCGITFFGGPLFYPMPAYAPLYPYMPIVGAVGMIGAAVLLTAGMPGQKWLPGWAVRTLGALMPLAILISFWRTNYYSGVVLWGTLTLTLLTGIGGFKPEPEPAEPPSADDSFPVRLEAMLERWLWLLAFSIVVLNLAVSTPLRPTIFVVVLCAYNTVAFRALRGRGRVQTRVRLHLMFVTAAIGLLLVHGSTFGHGFLALMAAIPAMGARAVGMGAGYHLLGIGSLAVLFSDGGLVEKSLDVVLLAVAAAANLGVAAQQRRSAAGLETALAHARATEAEKARLAAILEATPDVVAMTDAKGQLIFLNQAGRQLLGLDPNSNVRMILDLVPPDEADKIRYVAIPAAREHGVWTGEGTILSARGHLVTVSQVVIAHRDPNGDFLFSTIQRDIRSQKLAEHELRSSEERFRNAFEGAPIGMALLDLDGNLLQVNDALCAMLGYSPYDLLTLNREGISHPEDYEAGLPPEFIAGRMGTYQRERRFIHRDGHHVWVLVSRSLVKDAAGQPLYCISHVQDISERKSYEKQLMHLASFDPLTDLYNRRRFQEELERQMAEAALHGGTGTLMFIDLDQFKYVNDTLGHQAGDEFLRSVADALREQLRHDTDTVARLGGDEFAVVMPGIAEPAARVIASRILARLRQHVQVLAGQAVTSTASIGLATYPDHATTAADLLARADFAMYQAKEHGRNRYYCFRPGSDAVEQAESKLRWEQRIREALQQDRMELYCQPILDLRENRVSHCELLLRMIDEQGKVIPPGEFLPVAERFGLIQTIDRWVVRRAIQTIASEAKQGRRQVVEVNLSGLAFEDGGLMRLIRQDLADTGIDPGCLIFEITETVAIADLEQAHRFVGTLRDLGCRFAIDDFGSGFASFAYLKHLQVDYLKIDGSFIQNLVRDPVDQHLVKSMVEVARGLGKQTIAEFVGDAETMEMLREFGVDYAQGYHVGRPAPWIAVG